MLIDAHTHLGSLAGRSCTIDGLRSYLDAARIERAVVSNLDAASRGDKARDLDELDANLACLEASRIDPRIVPLYWVRPGRVDSNLHAFAGALDTESFGGAIFAARSNNFVADDARLDPYLSIVARLEKPAFFIVGREDAWRPSRVYNLARRFPRVEFVLCNTNPPAWNDCIDCMKQSRDRDDARLHLVTSHASIDDVAAVVREIGPDRLLFGSDGPGRGQEHAEQSGALLAGLEKSLKRDAFERVTTRNAAALLKRGER